MTKRSRRLALVALVALCLVLLTVGIALAQDTTVNVTLGLSEFKFDPAELSVPLNTVVTFNVSNTGQAPHNVTFVAPDGTETNLFGQNLAGGQSATGTFTFNAAGDWSMYCPVGQHKDRGMVGVVHVAAADAGAAAAATATPAATAAPAATSAPAAAAAPAPLPTTGGDRASAASLAAGVVLLASILLFVGLRLRRAH